MASQVGHPVGVRSLAQLAVRVLALVNLMLRELAETYYRSGEPSSWRREVPGRVLGGGTPLADAIRLRDL